MRTLFTIEFATYTHVPRGEPVVRQGDLSTSFYVLLSGALEVRVQFPDDRMVGPSVALADSLYGRIVARLLSGDSFGQLSAENGVKRTASVVAVCESELVEVSSELYKKTIHAHHAQIEFVPRLAMEVLRTPCVNRRDCACRMISALLDNVPQGRKTITVGSAALAELHSAGAEQFNNAPRWHQQPLAWGRINDAILPGGVCQTVASTNCYAPRGLPRISRSGRRSYYCACVFRDTFCMFLRTSNRRCVSRDDLHTASVTGPRG